MEQSHERYWLCIAQSFAPVNRSGTFRTLAFVRDLAGFGWQATVITADPAEASADDSLAELIPSSTSIVPTGSVDLIKTLKNWRSLIPARRLQTRRLQADVNAATGTPLVLANSRGSIFSRTTEVITQLLCTPDSRIGWIPSATRTAVRVLRERPAEILYSTSPCMSAHLIALLVKRWTGIPWVADFRDPWRDNGFRKCESRVINWWDALLEDRVLRHADRIICNTPTARARLLRRKPELSSKASVILNGIDFDAIARVQPERMEPEDCFVLAHCGQFYGPRSPRPWFRALSRLRFGHPALGAKVRFLSVGCETYDGEPLARIAQQEGVADLVRIFPHMSHRQSLGMAAGADALIVAGAAGPGADLQVPNKLFEYLGLRKPMVVAVDAQNPAHDILTKAKARATFCSPSDPETIEKAILGIAQPPKAPAADWSGVGQFGRTHRSAELRKLFDGLAKPFPDGCLGPAASLPVEQLAPLPIVRSGSAPVWTRSECSMPR